MLVKTRSGLIQHSKQIPSQIECNDVNTTKARKCLEHSHHVRAHSSAHHPVSDSGLCTTQNRKECAQCAGVAPARLCHRFIAFSSRPKELRGLPSCVLYVRNHSRTADTFPGSTCKPATYVRTHITMHDHAYTCAKHKCT